MLNKAREGSIMVVVALILIILPSLLIVSKLGGSSTKVLNGNMVYHQELLLQDSLKLLSEDTLILTLQGLDAIEVQRDVLWVDGLEIYGDYYVLPNTTIDLSCIEEEFEGRGSLYSFLGYDVVNIENLVYNEDLTTYAKATTPFEHNIVVGYKLKTLRNSIEQVYTLRLSAVCDVTTNIATEKGFITNITITDISLIKMDD